MVALRGTAGRMKVHELLGSVVRVCMGDSVQEIQIRWLQSCIVGRFWPLIEGVEVLGINLLPDSSRELAGSVKRQAGARISVSAQSTGITTRKERLLAAPWYCTALHCNNNSGL